MNQIICYSQYSMGWKCTERIVDHAEEFQVVLNYYPILSI